MNANKNLLAFIICLLSLVIGCFSLYNEKIVKKLPSSDGRWIAVIYIGDQGATGGSSACVNLFTASETFPSYSETPVRKGSIFEIDKTPNIKLKWLATNTLEIEYFAPKTWKAFKQQKNYRQIKIITKHTVVDKPILYKDIHKSQD